MWIPGEVIGCIPLNSWLSTCLSASSPHWLGASSLQLNSNKNLQIVRGTDTGLLHEIINIQKVMGEVASRWTLWASQLQWKQLMQVLELDSDDIFVKSFHWSSISQAYTTFYMLKTSQGQWLWMCIVLFIRILKALKHTHTHHKSYI